MPYGIINKYAPWAKMIESVGQSVGQGLEARQKAKQEQIDRALRQYELLGRLTHAGGIDPEDANYSVKQAKELIAELGDPRLANMLASVQMEPPRVTQPKYIRPTGRWAMIEEDSKTGKRKLRPPTGAEMAKFESEFGKKQYELTTGIPQECDEEYLSKFTQYRDERDFYGYGRNPDFLRMAMDLAWKEMDKVYQNFAALMAKSPEFQRKYWEKVDRYYRNIYLRGEEGALTYTDGVVRGGRGSGAKFSPEGLPLTKNDQ